MGEIVDMSRADRRANERVQEKRRKRAEARRRRTLNEFIQVCATTIGQYLQMIQWATSVKMDPEHLGFLGEACNYQLQCFARAYDWSMENVEDIPIRFDLTIAADPVKKSVHIDFDIIGALAEPVSTILAINNENLDVRQPEPQTDGK